MTRPRSSSEASELANGTSTWATTEVIPTMPRASASTARPGAAAAPARPTAATISMRETRRRRSTRSPSGTSNTRPAAYPICDAVTSRAALEAEVPRLAAIAWSSGWA